MVLRKHAFARFINFLFLLPFILAYRPLLVRFDRSSLIWYGLGTVVVITIIIISNHLPYITLKGDKLILNLHYYQNPEIHNLDRITLIEIKNHSSCRIHSRDYRPVRITLNPGDQKKLLKALSERNINIRML